MRTKLLNLYLYSNFILIIFYNFIISYQFSFAIYLILSISINTFIFINLKNIKTHFVNLLFLFYAFYFLIISIISYDLSLLLRYLWLLSCILVLFSTINDNRKYDDFDSLRKFMVFVAYVLIFDTLINFVLNPSFELSKSINLDRLIIAPPFDNFLIIIIFPFLLMSKKPKYLIAILFIIIAFTISRAAILAIVIELFLILFLKINANFNSFSLSIKRTLQILFLVSSVVIISILGNSFINKFNFNNNWSLIDRLVIWTKYSEVFTENLIGAGPNRFTTLVDFCEEIDENKVQLITSFIYNIDLYLTKEINNHNYIDYDTYYERFREREKIHSNRCMSHTPSEHSAIFDFILTFGIPGLIFVIYLLLIIFYRLKDIFLLKKVKNFDYNYIVVSTVGFLTASSFSSFHQGAFVISLLISSFFIFNPNSK